jgi:N6-adenosine-specific RNA methylase IME4
MTGEEPEMPDDIAGDVDAVMVDTGEIVTLSANGMADAPGDRGANWYRLPDGLSQEQWMEAGQQLISVERSVMWWIGDWWAYGESRYGDRVNVVREWDGPAFQTCVDAGTVCRKFESTRRRVLLSFNHHREVASLSAEEADAVLDWAEDPLHSPESNGRPRTIKDVRSEVNRRKNATAIGALHAQDGCTIGDLWAAVERGEKFGTVYADPPWLYDNQGTRAATGNHYGGMTVDELCALPIKQLSADDAHLHLWTTNAFLFDCPRIFDAWGYEFRSSFAWCKTSMGIGNYWRNSHELLLTAVRGDAKRFNDKSLMSWLVCDRGRHSAKPEQVRSFIERASPGPYLELFGRGEANGWKVWGNQVEPSLFSRPIGYAETETARRIRETTLEFQNVIPFCA